MGQMPFLPPNQQHQITESINHKLELLNKHMIKRRFVDRVMIFLVHVDAICAMLDVRSPDLEQIL